MDLKYEDIDLNLLKVVAEVNNLLDKLVYLKKDEKGYFIEYAFKEGAPHDNRCLSWYTKGYKKEGNLSSFKAKEVNKIYYLTDFTCGGEGKINECCVGKPKVNCNYLGYLEKNWEYENPKKCACWDLHHLNKELSKFCIEFSQIKSFLNIINHV